MTSDLQPRRPPAGELARRTLVVSATAAGVVVFLLMLWRGAEIVLLAFAGILLAVFLHRLATLLRRGTPLGQGAALAVVCGLLLAVAAGFFWLMAPAVSEQAQKLSQNLPAAIDSLRDSVGKTAWGEWILGQMDGARDWISERQVLLRARSVLSSAAGMAAAFLMILALGIFIAAEPRLYLRGVLLLVPTSGRGRTGDLLRAAGDTLWWWVIGRLAGSLVIGLLTWGGLALLGVPLALVLAFIAAVLNFVPYLGPLLAMAPALLVALMQGPNHVAYVVLLYLGIQAVESYLLTPLIERRTIRMPPALTLVAQIMGGAVIGPAAVLLASPLVALLLVAVKHLYVEDTLGHVLHED